MLKSEEVECISLYCGTDGVRNVIERLGETSSIQIIGTVKNSNSKEIQNLEKISTELNYLEVEVEKQHGINDEEAVEEMSFVDAQAEIQKYYEKLMFLKESSKLHRKEEQVLEQNVKMMDFGRSFSSEYKKSDDEAAIPIDFLVFISRFDKKLMIKKMLRHKLRKNLYIRSCDTILKSNGERYTIYIVYVLSDLHKSTASEIIKNLGGRVLNVPVTDQKIYSEIEERLKNIKKLNKSIGKQTNKLLGDLRSEIGSLKYAVNKEKVILETIGKLNKIEGSECYTGEAWILKKDLDILKKHQSFDNERGRFMFELTKTNNQKPTHFEPSEFSKAFQNLTNVFGIPKYGEINPAIFMIFTFPFLFGAMFGDVLHGLILLGISLYLIFNYKNLNRKCGVFQIILDGRYVVLACSFGAIWFGLLYGDFGSLPLSFFKSKYETGRTSLFGIDPVWHHADNRMIFVNSLKMKLSLIIGFFHMGLGSLISILNAINLKDRLTLICISIPQALAFFLFLGYLVFLCVYKWLVTVDHPSLVNTLISMYTDPFNMKNQMYPGQMYVQLFIFAIIIMCVPWMMLSKPLYLTLKRKVPKEGMLDLWITSGIHVVEFCLGLISNTSSYLRLWAVSLAHVQLTTVLHEFTLGSQNYIVKILTFPVYFTGTMMLLIGLEGLSSCLHALRLNWIEFFSKFYSGGGNLFEPLNFKIKEKED